MNDYDALSDNYLLTHQKPDKAYSMLPMALRLVAPEGKRIIDVGTGDGFYAQAFAQAGAFIVYGIDSSQEQIAKAKRYNNFAHVHYDLADMLDHTYPEADTFFCPYVLNYLSSSEQIEVLFRKAQNALSPHFGSLVSIVDMPLHAPVYDMQRFGSIKRIAALKDDEPMAVELYNGEQHLVTLHSFFHSKEQIEQSLQNTGFSNITWHLPIVSQEGVKRFGEEFWEEYPQIADVAYFVAKR